MAATAIVMSTFFMNSPLISWTSDEIGGRLIGIPDRELEPFEVIARLLVRVDGVDEAQRELEDRKEDPELRAGRIAHLRQVPLLAIVVRVAGVRKEHEAQRIVQAIDVFEVVNMVLVTADAAGET